MGKVAALFDMDKTLLDITSGELYVRYLYRIGKVGKRWLARVAWYVALGRMGLLDVSALIPRLVQEVSGDDEAELMQMCNLWFASDVIAHIAERGVERVNEHKAAGHVVAIVSASMQYVVEPMANYLGIPGQYVCTLMKSENGHLTGEVEQPICYGAGKVEWAERFAAANHVDLAASWFYTDSVSDLPLLERVAHPVAVNPDGRLRRIASQRGWPIEMFY
jgi:HAD superfamily hydrolase (TIGR01490 family)